MVRLELENKEKPFQGFSWPGVGKIPRQLWLGTGSTGVQKDLG